MRVGGGGWSTLGLRVDKGFRQRVWGLLTRCPGRFWEEFRCRGVPGRPLCFWSLCGSQSSRLMHEFGVAVREWWGPVTEGPTPHSELSMPRPKVELLLPGRYYRHNACRHP